MVLCNCSWLRIAVESITTVGIVVDGGEAGDFGESVIRTLTHKRILLMFME